MWQEFAGTLEGGVTKEMSTVCERPAPMSSPDAERKRDDQAVKIERAIAQKASLVCNRRKSKIGPGKLTLAEFLSDLLRAGVDREYAKELEAMQREMDQARKKT